MKGSDKGDDILLKSVKLVAESARMSGRARAHTHTHCPRDQSWREVAVDV